MIFVYVKVEKNIKNVVFNLKFDQRENMKHLARLTENLLKKIYSVYAAPLLGPSYTQVRLMSTSRVKPPETSLENKKIPQYELDAKLYRQRMVLNHNDTNAIYGLAVCIGLGASITATDIICTQRAAFWINKKITPMDVQASLYRTILRSHSRDYSAIWALAQCLRKGASPQFEDLKYTWLEGGNFITEDGPGLTKPVILLLAKALEERSKKIELASKDSTPTKTPKKSI